MSAFQIVYVVTQILGALAMLGVCVLCLVKLTNL